MSPLTFHKPNASQQFVIYIRNQKVRQNTKQGVYERELEQWLAGQSYPH